MLDRRTDVMRARLGNTHGRNCVSGSVKVGTAEARGFIHFYRLYPFDIHNRLPVVGDDGKALAVGVVDIMPSLPMISDQ